MLRPPHLAADGRGLADELAALVSTVLGTRCADEPFSASGTADLRRRVTTYVADHIEDLDLRVESIRRCSVKPARSTSRRTSPAVVLGALPGPAMPTRLSGD